MDYNARENSKTEKLPEKSRIYINTQKNKRLEEIDETKKMKTLEQWRKLKAKEMNRSLHLRSDTNVTIEPKRQKKIVETDSEI